MLVCVALATASALAAEPHEAFLKELEKVQTRLARGRYGAARAALVTLLRKHVDKNYARTERQRISDLMRLASFYAEVGRIDPASVVNGTLRSYNARTGQVAIEYTPHQMADWVQTKNGGLIFPAAFTGPHRIEILGRHYPADNYGVQVHVCTREQPVQSYRVIFGAVDDQGRRSGTEIEQVLPGKTVKLAGGIHLRDPGESYRLGVLVQKMEIIELVNGRAGMRARKVPGHWGHLIVLNAKDVTKIAVQGAIDSIWIKGKIDAARQKRLAEFEKSYDERKVLPPWLFKWPEPNTALARSDGRPWPVRLSDDDAKRLDQFESLLRKKKYADCLQFAKGPTALDAYCRSVVHRERQEYEDSLRETRRVTKECPEFVLGHVQEASLLSLLGRSGEALAILDPLVARLPGDRGIQGTAALVHMRAGDIEGATTIVDGALSRGVASETLERVKSNLTKSIHGPLWLDPHMVETKHYRVVTDIDRKVAREAADVLEQNYAGFVTHMERVPDIGKRKFVVYVFSGAAGYTRYCSDVFGQTHPGSDGLYDPLLKQLLIRHSISRESMMRTVRHEGFHQYLDRLMVTPPLWFNEGLAEYFEVARVVNGKWTLGLAHSRHKRWRPKGAAKLKTFLYLDRSTFMKNAAVNYGRAWSFVHFLRHGKHRHKQLFRAFWDAFKGETSNRAAMDGVLRSVDLDELCAAMAR